MTTHDKKTGPCNSMCLIPFCSSVCTLGQRRTTRSHIWPALFQRPSLLSLVFLTIRQTPCVLCMVLASLVACILNITAFLPLSPHVLSPNTKLFACDQHFSTEPWALAGGSGFTHKRTRTCRTLDSEFKGLRPSLHETDKMIAIHVILSVETTRL